MFTVVLLILCVVGAVFLLQIREVRVSSRKLEDHLPIWKVEQDYIISKQGDVTLAFEISLPEVFTSSNEEFEVLHQMFVRAIRVLPKHTVFHKQDWFTEEKYQPDFSKEQSFLSHSSERFFNERPFLHHRCYAFITKLARERRLSGSVVSNLFKRHIIPVEMVDEKLIAALSDAGGQFAKILTDSGMVRVRRMTKPELIGSEDKAGLIERYCFLTPEKDVPVVRDIVYKPEFKVGPQYVQMFTLAELETMPAMCGPRMNYERYSTDRTKFSVGFASAISLLLSRNHIYNQYVVIGDAQKAIKLLEARKLRLQSLSAYSRQNEASRDAANAFLHEAVTDQRMPVRAHFNVMLWCEDREQLQDIRNDVSAALAQMDAVPKEEISGAPQLHWAGIPGNASDLPHHETFDTFAEQAACFFNFETNYRTSSSPIGIKLGDRLTGRPVHVDISDEPMRLGVTTNRNKFVLGPSGSGKSYTMQAILRAYHEQNSHIVIVDVGHSYRGLCSLAKGYYFTYEENNPIKFNPFYISDGDYMDVEHRESIKTLLVALWKKDTETYKRSEYVALSNAISMYYAHLAKNESVFPCFDTFYEFLKGTFHQELKRENVKEKDFDIDNFLYVLRPYYKGGEFDYLLNARENLDILHERFVVFEIDAIMGNPILLPVTTLIIMQVFISKMRKLNGLRKIIVIEEAWKALAREGMAEYIQFLFKTVRKYFGEAIVVTQEVDDIISSPIVKNAIINNSDCKILLDQSKYQNKFDQIQTLLGLTEKQKTEILSLNKANEEGRRYKEVWIGLGSTHSRVYRVEVSKAEHYAYTTEQKEKVKVYEYVQMNGGDMERGIAALLSAEEDEKRDLEKQ